MKRFAGGEKKTGTLEASCSSGRKDAGWGGLIRRRGEKIEREGGKNVPSREEDAPHRDTLPFYRRESISNKKGGRVKPFFREEERCVAEGSLWGSLRQ